MEATEQYFPVVMCFVLYSVYMHGGFNAEVCLGGSE